MQDSRVYDMINVFKFSPTRNGDRRVGGSSEFQSRYRRLVNNVEAELWRLWSGEEIGFDDLPANTYGDSDRRSGYDILINRDFEPSMLTYDSEREQSKLAAASLILVHEAVHLVRGLHGEWELDEEMACRKLGTLYFADLNRGLTYRSRVTGANCTAKLLPNPPTVASFINQVTLEKECDAREQLIDLLLSDRVNYREYLTPAFVDRSFDWWGGIRNRWPQTKGYYLRVLSSGARSDGSLIVEILESITSYDEWQTVRSTAGDLGAIRNSGGYRLLAQPTRQPRRPWVQWIGLEPERPALEFPPALNVFEQAEPSDPPGPHRPPRQHR